ncbi:FAD synthase [Geosmithia morbida]|uniref:Riboflavin kinase n=1 Tax=Geosmithia morbida TaxID=1094350 RepID=A0A9P4YLZ2_9HYPO|nr:FAD synthase [Geosmithia morbida]KAF4119421.1 FAD synthase [Geosmithia morbida]
MDPPRRRPVPQSADSYSGRPMLDPNDSTLSKTTPPSATIDAPRPLRFARSATNLRSAHQRPSTGISDRDGGLPVGFVVDDVPPPPYLLSAPTYHSGAAVDNGGLRRVRSSSALSAQDQLNYPNVAQQEDDQVKPQSRWNAALGEAQYFAGGLITRPAESTRHHTIIRHSHALVWYRGPSTSVSITILSDTELPSTRTIWIQQKGYSGNMGMNLKALVGTTGSWLDVTPETKAGPEHLPDIEERGIQRDLGRFIKKSSGRQKKHVPRETLIVRIPAAATDGYFRLVLCSDKDGKKVLCGCPVFRVASTSADASVMRGASLKTIPLEVGVKVGSTVAQQFAKRYTGPASLILESKAAKVVSHKTVKTGASLGMTALQTTGIDQAVMESWKKHKVTRYDPILHDTALLPVLGPDSGPEDPFPLAFDGRVSKGTGISTTELGLPTANLRGVRDEIKMRLKGVYAAWACVSVPSNNPNDGVSGDWYPAIVTIAPLRYAPPEVVMKNRVAVHLMHDFSGALFYDMKVKAVLVGYLHPPMPRDADLVDVVRQHDEDVISIMASLGREMWSAERVINRHDETLDRVGAVVGSVQGRIDRVPLHLAGVRSEIATLRDKVYGNGGIWIPR